MLVCTSFSCLVSCANLVGVMEDENELDSTDNEVGQVAWMEQLKEYFSVVKEEGKNVRVQCKRCLPKQTILSTSKISPANLLKHVEVRFFLMFINIHAFCL